MTERDFLMSLKAGLVPCPGDIDTVLILADWLDEDGQYQKAAWIRQQVKEGGIPHFDEEIQPDLFFRRGIKWKVFRNGRPGSINVGVYHLVDLYQGAPWHQKRILRGLLIALYDQASQPEIAIWYAEWLEDVGGVFWNTDGTVYFEVNGPDFIGWEEGPAYYEGYIDTSRGADYLEFRRHPGN